MPSVTIERSASFATIRLNRPDKLNALSREMLLALGDTFKQLTTEPDLRAVILTGTGDKGFCSGTDVSELDGLNEAEVREAAERGKAVCDQIERCAVPVLAAVNGIAAGGGFELVLACHIRIASSNARFSLTETKLGLMPVFGGAQRLAREIGPGRALELMLTGRVLTAAEAFRIGLVNRAVDAEDIMRAAEALAREIGQLAPLAIRACLQAVTGGHQLPLQQALALETELFAGLFATDDRREGTRAFLERRSPAFKGT